jgi:hypothetical protein
MCINQFVFRNTVAMFAFLMGVLGVFLTGNPSTSERREISKPDDLQVAELNEEYVVYSAVLDAIYFNEETVISNRTKDNSLIYRRKNVEDIFPSSDDPYRMRSRSNELSVEALTDFVNKESAALEEKFTTGSKVFLLSPEEEARLFPKGGAGWEKFYQNHPKAKGIFYLSNIGFNREKTEAFVNVAQQCGGFCNEYGSYYLLKKINGHWEITWRNQHNY